MSMNNFPMPGSGGSQKPSKFWDLHPYLFGSWYVAKMVKTEGAGTPSLQKKFH